MLHLILTILMSNALQFDGANGTRLVQATEIEVGEGEAFEEIEIFLLLRVDDESMANATIAVMRSAAAIGDYEWFWRLGRLLSEVDAVYTRPQFLHNDSSGSATHYYGEIPSGPYSPRLNQGQWYAVSMWRDASLLDENDDCAEAVVNGTVYELRSADAIGALVDPNVVLSFGGLTGSPTTNQAKITICEPSIWNRKLTTDERNALHGITTPGTYRSPLRYRTGLRHFYPPGSLIDSIGGNNLTADNAGVSVVTDAPSGVETMTAYSSQPDGTANNDGSFRPDTGANAAPNGTTQAIGNSVAGSRRYFTKLDLHEDGAIGTTDSLGTWLLTLMCTIGGTRDNGGGGAVAEALNATISVATTDGALVVDTSTQATIGALSATTVAFTTPATDTTAKIIDITTLVQVAVSASIRYMVLVIQLDDEAGSDVVSFTIGTADNATAGNRPLLEGSFTAAAAGGGGTLNLLVN